MNNNQFLQYRQQVTEVLNGYNEIKKKANISDAGFSASIKRKAAPFIKGHFTLAIVGKMNAGKSTFINAFLGNKNVLPTGFFQTTCALTKIEYAEQKSIKIHYGDNHNETILDDISGKLGKIVAIEPQYSSLPINSINEYILKGLNKIQICDKKTIMDNTSCRTIDKKTLENYIDNHPKSKVATEVIIKYPLPEDCQGWCIVDTPGVAAVGGIDNKTIQFLTAKNKHGGNNIDAIIFLHKGTDNIEDKSINDFIKGSFNELSDEAKKRIFFVVTNAANNTFRSNKDEYMKKAKALFVDPYSIQNDRLIAVDSLMETLHHYVVTEHKDIVSLINSKTPPDESWCGKVWEECRSLVRNIIFNLTDEEKNVNNENILDKIQDWSNFGKLRGIINEFIKTEKINAYNDLLKSIREDIEQCIEAKKNDNTLLQKGIQEMREQITLLDKVELKKNRTLGLIRQEFSKEAVAKRFDFIEQTIESKIKNEEATYKTIRSEAANLYDLTDKENKKLFNKMSEKFSEFIIEPANVFFQRPDFDELEAQAEKEATEDKEEIKVRMIPGFCPWCSDYEEYIEKTQDVNSAKRLRAFKTSTAKHIRNEARNFKNTIQEKVDTYVKEVNESLQSNINTQKKHLEELLLKYNTSSDKELEHLATVTSSEIEEMNRFLNSILN